MIVIKKLKQLFEKIRLPIVGLIFPVIFEILHSFGGEWIIDKQPNCSTANIFAGLIAIIYIILTISFGLKDYNTYINIENLTKRLENVQITFNGVQNLLKYRYNDVIKKNK